MLSNGFLGPFSETGRLTATTFGGTDILGTDFIRIVQGSSAIAAIPEPSTISLVVLGLLGVFGCCCRHHVQRGLEK